MEPTAPTDPELLTAWVQHRDEAAFHALVSRYTGLVHSAAKRACGGDSLAAEASQLTFILLARKAKSLTNRSSLGGWLYLTAAGEAKNLLRSSTRETRKRSALLSAMAIHTPDAPDSSWQEIQPFLNDALAALSANDREAILLRFYRSLSVREIAATLGIANDAAQKRLDRATERLREKLTRRGVTTTGSLSAVMLAGFATDANAAVISTSVLSAKAIAAASTARGNEHEITTLKRQDKEALRCGAAKGRSTLMIYDTAIIDFQYAYNLKQSKSIYILTAWKDNFAPMTVIAREIDPTHPANELIISDETLYFNNTPGVWRRITASCPDSDEIYVTLTNQMNHTPGALNQCRRLRWNIEKAFDQQEQKLDERKAWATSETGKRIQAIAMSIAHNLLRLFTTKLKTEENIEDSKVIRAWQKDLVKRAEKARAAGRTLPVKLYQALYRPTEVSLQFIRWLRVGLMRPTCYSLAIEGLRPLMQAYL